MSVIRAAERLQGRVRKTPVVQSAWLSAVTGADVLLKLENLQIEGSFKTRGAFHALQQAGVRRAVTASAGNHGRSLAFAAKDLGVALTVFAPRTAPRAKLDYIGAHGAALELCDSYDEAEQRALDYAGRLAVPYISPYNNRDVIAGAGTVGLEAMQEHPDVIVVPVGGGGLASGVALAARMEPVPPVVIGVEAAASPAFTTALAQGRLVPIEVGETLADGLAGNAEPDSITFALIRDNVSDVLAVDEAYIAAAMRGLLAHDGQRAEGAGAVGVAALLAGIAGLAGKRVIVIVSGGNVDDARLASV
ncbi:MAG: pyridoxal-phosphate dependent enzyme [Acidobacteria bacterium]|nr:pyridoxal-phosphate dependent enzyme [Acidobacteriota bacterium]